MLFGFEACENSCQNYYGHTLIRLLDPCMPKDRMRACTAFSRLALTVALGFRLWALGFRFWALGFGL